MGRILVSKFSYTGDEVNPVDDIDVICMSDMLTAEDLVLTLKARIRALVPAGPATAVFVVPELDVYARHLRE